MHSEDGATQIIFWDNLNVVVAENGVSKVNFKGFMVINAQANWNAMGRIYSYSDSNMPMVSHVCTCSFHWFVSLDKVTQKYNRPSLHFQHEQICKDYNDTKAMSDDEIEYHVICLQQLSSEATTKEDILRLSKWLGFWHFHYRQWGGQMLIVSTS